MNLPRKLHEFSSLAPPLLGCALAAVWTSSSSLALANEFHVSVSGDDANPGSADKPFKTVQKAADLMQPGDVCTVHAGTYREWVKPARGGTSESARIVYRAAPAEAVYLTGAERITSWTRSDGVWKAVVPNTRFGQTNPYASVFSGEYLTFGNDHHLGAVYFNGEAFREKTSDSDVTGTPKSWHAQVDANNTTIVANFGAEDPNGGMAEINVRKYVFAPSVPGLGFITLEGFHVLQAATNWAPPTAKPQEGMIMTNFGFKWIIQNNEISDSRAVCIASGIGTADHSYDINKVGNHLIRNNIIRRCGEAGVAGSHGLPASVIERNLFEDINPLNEFGGWEGAAIKIHSAVDVLIKDNVIRAVHGPSSGGVYGIWLDWQSQGSRLSGNVIYEVDQSLLNLEMDHGPTLLDNGVFVGSGIADTADNTIYVHNLFANTGYSVSAGDGRTPGWFSPHTTNQTGSGVLQTRDNKYFNNVYVGTGLSGVPQGMRFAADYNVFYGNAQGVAWGDAHSKVVPGFNPAVTVTSLANGAMVSYQTDDAPRAVMCPLITRDFIGATGVTAQGIEEHDGTPITVDKDLLGAARDATHPSAGPLEASSGKHTFMLLVGPDAPLATGGRAGAAAVGGAGGARGSANQGGAGTARGGAGGAAGSGANKSEGGSSSTTPVAGAGVEAGGADAPVSREEGGCGCRTIAGGGGPSRSPGAGIALLALSYARWRRQRSRRAG